MHVSCQSAVPKIWWLLLRPRHCFEQCPSSSCTFCWKLHRLRSFLTFLIGFAWRIRHPCHWHRQPARQAVVPFLALHVLLGRDSRGLGHLLSVWFGPWLSAFCLQVLGMGQFIPFSRLLPYNLDRVIARHEFLAASCSLEPWRSLAYFRKAVTTSDRWLPWPGADSQKPTS